MNGKMIITRADEVAVRVAEGDIEAVLSIEHPGAKEDTLGYAPRLSEVPQKILTFWDVEQAARQGPDAAQVKEGVDFIVENIAYGNVLVHCLAGKSRSTAIALGALAILNPEDDEKMLIAQLLVQRPQAAPNIIIVDMVDKLAGRDGRLLQAVLDHPLLAAQRRIVEENRQRALRERPNVYRQIHPEKFPRK